MPDSPAPDLPEGDRIDYVTVVPSMACADQGQALC